MRNYVRIMQSSGIGLARQIFLAYEPLLVFYFCS
jgi:hypothetical protein